MESIMNYVKPELLILIPVLYFIGMGFKRSQMMADKHIPLLLGAVGVALALLWVLASSELSGTQNILQAAFTAITQGVLCAGCSVYINQLGKQHGKED